MPATRPISRRRATLVALASAACLSVAGCSVSATGGVVATDEGATPPPAGVTTTALSAADEDQPALDEPHSTIPYEPEGTTDEAGCLELSEGPWKSIPHGPDPIKAIREGRELNVEGELARDDPPDETREFASPEEYEDRSPITDLDSVREAMAEAGFVHGIEVRWGSGHLLAAIDVIEFEDADGAKAAVSAHLASLCDHTVEATVRDDGTGLTLIQDDSTVRTIFARGDVEISVMTCSCYADSDRDRKSLLDQWSDLITDELEGPKPAPGEG